MIGLKGFRGQSMSGQKSETTDPFPIKFMLSGPVVSGDALTTSFTAPESALYQFAIWGAGGGDGSEGGGGAGLSIKTARLSIGAVVALVLGAPNSGLRDSSATFPDGSVMVAGGGGDGTGTGGAGGAASGGDINVPGAAGTGSVGGQAASYGNYVGGIATRWPGGGGRVAGEALNGPSAIIVTKVSL